MNEKELIRVREEYEMWRDEYRRRGDACNTAVESFRRRRRTIPGTRLTTEEFSKIDTLRQSASEARAKREAAKSKLDGANEEIRKLAESAPRGRRLHNEVLWEAERQNLPIWSFAEALRMAKDKRWSGYQAEVRAYLAEAFGTIQPVEGDDGTISYRRVPINLKEGQFLIPRYPVDTIRAYETRIARLCEDASYYPANGTGQTNATSGTGGDLALTNYDYTRMVGPEFASDWMDKVGVPTVSESRVGKTKVPTIPTVGDVTVWSGEGSGVSLASNTTSSIEYGFKYASWAWDQSMLSKDLTPSEATAFLFTNIAERQIRSKIAALAISGSGSNAQPAGILNHASVTQVSMGTNGGALTHAALVGLWDKLMDKNIDGEELFFVLNSATIAKASNTPTISGGNNQILTAPDGTIFGSRVVMSNAIPKTTTVGTTNNTSSAILLSPLAILRWFYGPMRFSYDDVVLNGSTVGCMTQPFDLAVHDPNRVAVLTGVITA